MAGVLYLAAGGGGDALAALILARRHDGDGEPPTVASYSWDRRILDPEPGPRRASDFTGLDLSTGCPIVTPSARLRLGRSSLPLVAATGARVVLLDPHGGTAELRDQLAVALTRLGLDSVAIVDVGGDLVAAGDEPGLQSPLADSLTLAAVTGLPVPVTALVAGPGLDGELSPNEVRARCHAFASGEPYRLAPADIAPHFAALGRHPTEATTLLAAAALGIHGTAEIRDNAGLITLRPASADVHTVDALAVRDANRLARLLEHAHSLAEAETVTRQICGASELDRERAMASTVVRRAIPTSHELRSRYDEYRANAVVRGTDLTTFRRLTEALQLPTYDPGHLRALLRGNAHPHLALAHTTIPG